MICKRISKKFIKHFARGDNWHELDVKSGDLGYGWIHYSLIKLLKPRRVLVVGSRYGFVPAVCAQALKDIGGGVVDFVDAGYQSANPQDKNHWGGVGFWKKVNVDKHFNRFGLYKYINFYLMTSEEYVKKYLKRKYDYVYLDGDHSYKGVKGDFDRFWPRLNKEGYLALHDIYTTHNLGNLDYGVNKFWQEIKKSKRYNQVEFPGQCGLGIIQKI